MIEFTAIRWLILAAILAIAIVAVIAHRRISMPRAAKLLGTIGLLLIAIAAGEPVYRAHERPRIAVLVDYSSSTRTATYRDQHLLQRRVSDLLGGEVDSRLIYFSDRTQSDPPTGDMSSDRTRFPVVANVDAILLLSDGQFALPERSPPVYAVIDRALQSPRDNAVLDLDAREDDSIAATVRNAGNVKGLSFLGATSAPLELIGEGTLVVSAKRDPSASRITATFRADQTDAWPENDTLSIIPPAALGIDRWWIGADAPNGFAAISELPTDLARYVEPSIIVLNGGVSSEAQQQLTQYVRDLGGAVVMIGAAIDLSLSPLSAHPSDPKRQWMILIDSSGSMAAPVDPSRSRWKAAIGAVRSLIDSLPPDDLLSVGAFARDLRWWTLDNPVRNTAIQFATDDSPSGPTNLGAALDAIATRKKSSLPIELIVVSDADATIESPSNFAKRLADAGVRVNAFALSAAPSALHELVRATGGKMLTATTPDGWWRDLRELARQIAPPVVMHDPVRVRYENRLNLPDRDVAEWRPAWLKSGAATMSNGMVHGSAMTLAAEQQIGLGRVFAMSYDPSAAERDAIIARTQRIPRDPRFIVTWSRSSTLRVTVDAYDESAKRYLDGLQLSLRTDRVTRIPQTAPGRYELSIDAPHEPTLATVVNESGPAVIARSALAGRYAQEFYAIGIDRTALRELVDRSGGEVIEPDDLGPIKFAAMRTSPHDLTTLLAICGAIALGACIVFWRRAA